MMIVQNIVILLMKKLEKFNIRCKFDNRQEKLNYKNREFSLQKIPFIAVVGAKDYSNPEYRRVRK